MRTNRTRFFVKILSAALAVSVAVQPALAAGSPVLPEGYHSPFSDVGENQWFYPYVSALNSQGVIAGYDDGRFGPDDATRAGDAMIMLLKAAGCGAIEPPQDAHYATGYQSYAVNKGWMSWEQVSDLNAPISRLLIARLAAQAVGLQPSASQSPFVDLDDGYVTALYEAGLISGVWEGDALLFQPERSITRAQISAVVWQVQRYAGSIHFGSYVLEVLPGVPVNPYDPAAFQLRGDRMTYTGEGIRADLGVDVSYHQGEINWRQVARDGISFAMIRAGGRYYGVNSGTIFEDSQFKNNIQGALDAGLETGVYFFSQAVTVEEAEEEARFLLELLKGYEFTGPVVFDWENIDYDTARTDGVDSATVTAMANAFCQIVEGAGYRPMIYFNRYIAYLLYDLEEVDQYPFWLAEYDQTPQFYYGFQIWQYTDKGRVDGIQGGVDMNIRLTPQ